MSYNKTENAQHVFEQSSISIWIQYIGIFTIFIGVISFCLALSFSEDARQGYQIVLLIVLLVGVLLTGSSFLAASAALDAVQETAENTRAMRKIMSD